jgi:hypothetical protein
MLCVILCTLVQALKHYCVLLLEPYACGAPLHVHCNFGVEWAFVACMVDPLGHLQARQWVHAFCLRLCLKES